EDLLTIRIDQVKSDGADSEFPVGSREPIPRKEDRSHHHQCGDRHRCDTDAAPQEDPSAPALHRPLPFAGAAAPRKNKRVTESPMFVASPRLAIIPVARSHSSSTSSRIAGVVSLMRRSIEASRSRI